MRYLLSILLFTFTITSCEQEDVKHSEQASFDCIVEKWESLGGQTLVVLDAHKHQSGSSELNLRIEATNELGEVFSKDTTIRFSAQESEKHFQLILETSGEVRAVNVYRY